MPTKFGLMLWAGDKIGESRSAMHDEYQAEFEILVIGRYQVPSDSHLPVERCYTREEFDDLRVYGATIGFKKTVSRLLVRSCSHAEVQSGLL